MSGYSPFERDIDVLRAQDLAVLTLVKEGWYVEYKREPVRASALAKELSAFANTYGGWLFLGIEEHSPDDPVAIGFPGIPNEQIDNVLKRLRNSAADNVNPTPYFRQNVLRGPCRRIALPRDRSVVVVEVPESHTAPHVHRDGRIYRRVGEGSEPKAETDRFILDQLWQRRERMQMWTRQWIERDPKFTDVERVRPYLRLLFCADPWRQRNPQLSMSFADFRTIVASETKTLPLDVVYPTTDGFIARQVETNDPYQQVLTWQVRRDGSCEVILALLAYQHSTVGELHSTLEGYRYCDRFIELLKRRGHDDVCVADLNVVIPVLMGVIARYRRLLLSSNFAEECYVKTRILNADRWIPFIDAEAVLDQFTANGIPLLFEEAVSSPPGNDPESFVRMISVSGDLADTIAAQENGGNRSNLRDTVEGFLRASFVFTFIMRAFGVAVPDGENRRGAASMLFSELFEAQKRAKLAQENRNRRSE